MKFRQHSQKKRGLGAVLDLTPIVDMVFNLLIFFAVSLNFAATSGGINVKLPKASSAEPIKQEQVTINLTEKGDTYFNNKKVTHRELLRRLKAKKDKGSLVIIRADSQVTHGRVVTIMDAVKSSGFSKLAIAVEQGARQGTVQHKRE